MAEPTFEIFGTGTQRIASSTTVTESGLFIPDSDLIAAGLGSPDTATAEGHLAAIVKKSREVLTEENYNANLDQSIYYTAGFNQFVNRDGVTGQLRQDVIEIRFVKPDINSSLSPGDY